MAIMARWRMPPENWWGYSSRRVSGEGMPTSLSSSMARRRFSSLDSFSPSKASYIWLRMRSTGLRAVLGS